MAQGNLAKQILRFHEKSSIFYSFCFWSHFSPVVVAQGSVIMKDQKESLQEKGSKIPVLTVGPMKWDSLLKSS